MLLCAFAAGAKDNGRAFVYYYDQANGLYDYFIKAGEGKWEEINVVKNEVKYRFRTVSEAPEQTVLYDEERNIYIRLTASKCYWSADKTDITKYLYDGYWVALNEGPSASSLLAEGNDIFIYEKSECRGFFTKHGKDWLEYSYRNGILLNTYTLVEQADDHILLQNNRGGYFVKLKRCCCCYSASRNGDYNRMYRGHWTGKGLSKDKANQSGNGLSHGRAFYYYLKDNFKSYYGYYVHVSGNNWDEVRISDEKVLFHYRLISESATAVILFDESRSVYVRLTEDNSFWGSSADNINDKGYYGAWSAYDYGYSVTMLLEIEVEINIFIFEYSGFRGYYLRSDDGYWIEYGYAGGSAINTYIIIEESPAFIILYCGRCGYYAKITNDGIYYSDTKDGNYTKKGTGEWTKGKVQNGPETKSKPGKTTSTAKPAITGGTNVDVLTALKTHVRDSVMKVMKLSALSNKAIADKKIDKKKLETIAADIAARYLVELKKNAIKKFNGKTIKLSAFDQQKQTYTLVWNTDIFIISVPASEAESFKTNWSKMTFSDPDFFFDGTRFSLSALKITNPVLKKIYAYDVRNQKHAAPVVKVNDLDVAMPAN